MSHNKKPRKKYRPRNVTTDTMSLALHRAAKPSAADRDEVLGLLRDSIKALREGAATEIHWSIASGSVSVALAIERQGIVRGLLGHIQAADQALQEMYYRAIQIGGWRSVQVTLYAKELDALQTVIEIHTFQLDQLGRAELLSAIDAARKDTIAQGHTATVVKDFERLAA